MDSSGTTLMFVQLAVGHVCQEVNWTSTNDTWGREWIVVAVHHKCNCDLLIDFVNHFSTHINQMILFADDEIVKESSF